MSQLFTFRVLIDYEKDVFRDIEIESNQNFEELHKAIQTFFKFDNSQISSFYVSDDFWTKGEEIGMVIMEDSENSKTIYNTKLEEIVTAPKDKLIYVSDFYLMWCFYVELVKISEINPAVFYPNSVTSYGDAPDQYSKKQDFTLDTELIPKSEEEGDIFEGFDDFDDIY